MDERCTERIISDGRPKNFAMDYYFAGKTTVKEAPKTISTICKPAEDAIKTTVNKAIPYKLIKPIMGMVERSYDERNNVDTFSNDIYDLFSWEHASEEWALISGEVRDDSTIDYMRNVIGFVQAFGETGALGVLDLQIIFS